MTPYDPEKHHRRSVRWRGYDYAGRGAYFVTLVVQGRLPLFGAIQNEEVRLNPAGQMVIEVWRRLGERWPHIGVDSVVVMPNHLHGILWLHDSAHRPKPDRADYVGGLGRPTERADPEKRAALGSIVRGFKASTQRAYALGVREQGWTRYPGRLWQRSFYDRVVRNMVELGAIREYIRLNPIRWEQDPERGH